MGIRLPPKLNSKRQSKSQLIGNKHSALTKEANVSTESIGYTSDDETDQRPQAADANRVHKNDPF